MARYYDSAIGKFTSQDPKGFKAGDANLYRYDGNNPINRTDPSGTSWDSLGLPNWAWGWVGGSLLAPSLLSRLAWRLSRPWVQPLPFPRLRS